MARTKKLPVVEVKTAKTKKKTEPIGTPKNMKRYSVAYTIGSNPDFWVADGDDYKLSTMDLQSPNTKEMSSFPVVFVVNTEMDTMDIIPMSNVALIRHNFGVKAEVAQFTSEMEAMKEKIDATEETIINKAKRAKHDDERHYQ